MVWKKLVGIISSIPLSYLIVTRIFHFVSYNFGTGEGGGALYFALLLFGIFIFSLFIFTRIMVFFSKENLKLFYIMTGIIFVIPIIIMLAFPLSSVGEIRDEYLNKALESGDTTFCGEMGMEYYKNKCYTKIAKIKNDESICKKIISITGVRFDCYEDIAKLKNDPNICKILIKEDKLFIEEGSYWDRNVNECIENIAIKTMDLSICEEFIDAVYYYNYRSIKEERIISKKDYKNRCISVLTKDKTLCSSIENSDIKNRCEDGLFYF